SAAAATLNRIVVDTFLEAGVAVLSLPPSASLLAEGGRIVILNDDPIRRALAVGLVPLIFGDTAFDQQWGGTILSTEDLFFFLAEVMRPARILLLGNAPGVLDDARQVIPCITPETYPQVKPHLYGARYADVTGGMADKVEQMVTLVQRLPGLEVRILTGQEPGNLTQALLHPETALGTCIVAH
ncbi:MAG TPA: uridylate kinase, partial [Anaerolineae bacterium]|nr:uridylate kinase [Anaerolineae bacterium]